MQPQHKTYKKATLAVILLLQAALALGQTAANVNNIRIRMPRMPETTTAGVDAQMTNKSAVNVTYEYMDGLGRPLQTVQMYGSPTGNDIVQPYIYDQFSRDSVKYLPFTINSPTPGAFQPTAIAQQYQFYQQAGQGYVNTLYPYAGIAYEPSDLNRTAEQGDAGTAWQLAASGVTGGGHTVKMDYASNSQSAFAATPLTNNTGSRMVALYTATINPDGSRTLARTGNTATYATGELYITISKDENWNAASDGCLNTTEEYKDMEGHVVLKRTYNNTGTALQMLSTYYVYDDYGLLAFVLPPGATPDANTTITQTTLDNLCYQYQYDDHGRQSAKKMPGKGWEYTAYNIIDQPVATQDANQQANKQWIFTKYDGDGRAIMTGIWTNGSTAITQANLQTNLNSQTILWETPVITGTGYTAAAWPTSSTTPLTINYYDNYTAIPSLPSTFAAPTGTSIQTRGLLTATKTAILNALASMLWTAHYYDDLGRNIESYSQHYLHAVLSNNNYDAISTTYSFVNQPTTVTRKHWNTLSTTYPELTAYNKYVYDWMGRKLNTWEQLTTNNAAADTMRLVSNAVYNEIGQLKFKNLHSRDSVNYLQSINYAYNERGWLLSSSAPLFAMQLYYNTGTQTAYNGNIMYQFWGLPGNLNNHYKYSYDQLNRLLSGITTLDNYQESGITYDTEGNFITLNRYQAGTEIDQLGYNYTLGGNPTNQLQSVTDANASNSGLVSGTTNYTYDGNGNMLSAANTVNTGQNKSFTYNLLNLPSVATMQTGTATYTYDADGTKWRKVDVLSGVTTQTEYINGIQYDGAAPSQLDFIQTEEGKAVKNGNTYEYIYYLGDNLGNTRVTFGTKNGIAQVYQQDDYYPFGLEILRAPPVPNPKNEYLYNKKELQEEFAEYDYGARYYDPVIARWTSVDPKAQMYENQSTYSYVLDNPISFTDPDGKGPTDPPTLWQRILAYLHIGPKNQPTDADEAREQYERTEAVLQVSKQLNNSVNSIKRKADWVPFLGALMHVSSGMVSHSYKEAGFGFGMGLVDVIGGELIGKGGKLIAGAGKEVLEGVLSKVSNLSEHLSEKDITGAIRDIFNDPVLKKDGTPFDHLKEVNDALKGLGNQIEKLNKGIENGTFSDDVLENAKKLRSELQKQKDKIQNILNKAKSKANE